MAIIDSTLQFASATTVALAAGTANLGNVVDLTVARNVGRGEDVALSITVTTGITVASSTGTIQFRLVADSSATPSTSAPAQVFAYSPVFATSTTAIAAGTVLWTVDIPAETGQAAARYMGVQVIVGTTTINAGAVSAELLLDGITKWDPAPAASY